MIGQPQLSATKVKKIILMIKELFALLAKKKEFTPEGPLKKDTVMQHLPNTHRSVTGPLLPTAPFPRWETAGMASKGLVSQDPSVQGRCAALRSVGQHQGLPKGSRAVRGDQQEGGFKTL